MKKLTVLVVDDEQGYRDEISEYLTNCGFNVEKAERPSKALDIISTSPIDVAVLDIRLPEMNGIELLKKMLKIDPDLAAIMISGHGDMDCVISAMREGAVDFFTKPFDLTDIQISIQRLQKYLKLQNEVSTIRETCDRLLNSGEGFEKHQLIGQSDTIKGIVMVIEQVSKSANTDVLITGESGTGKEIVGRLIHQLSSENNRTFFDVNCTAIPDNLFESEFFGHTKNAFTGAVAPRKGWFEIANKGTLLLDEIGDMSLAMQAKLLRVLEERKIRPVGSSQEIHLDLRVIASTNQNLLTKVEQNLFRKDLYYRLNKFNIYVPPLRDHPDDIVPLLDYYNRRFSFIMKKPVKPFHIKTMEILTNYHYPGNVRELKNIVEKAVIMSNRNDKYLKIDNIYEYYEPKKMKSMVTGLPNLSVKQLSELEKEMILQAMQKTKNNKTRAARLLNLTRTSLNRRIHKYQLSFGE